jgi:hypothetical protein
VRATAAKGAGLDENERRVLQFLERAARGEHGPDRLTLLQKSVDAAQRRRAVSGVRSCS